MMKIIVDYSKTKNSKIILSVKKNENLIYMLVVTKPVKKEVIVKLKEKGARAQILGFILGREGNSEIKTLQHHQAPHTKSDLLIRSVLFNQAKHSYQGKIRIDKKAQGTNAYQKNDNLLMGSKAQIETEPELEILANDIRCTHGATVGKIDEENLFYLKSRGIPQKKAEMMLVNGFISDVINRLPDKKEKKKLEEVLEKELTK